MPGFSNSQHVLTQYQTDPLQGRWRGGPGGEILILKQNGVPAIGRVQVCPPKSAMQKKKVGKNRKKQTQRKLMNNSQFRGDPMKVSSQKV